MIEKCMITKITDIRDTLQINTVVTCFVLIVNIVFLSITTIIVYTVPTGDLINRTTVKSARLHFNRRENIIKDINSGDSC